MPICRLVNALALSAILSLTISAAALAHPTPPSAGAHAPTPYAPYTPLMGEWHVGREGQSAQLIERFVWAGGGSYIEFSAATLDGGHETPHFEGVLMWNGVRRALDMLVMLDLSPSARVLEGGTLQALPDGSFVREITAYYSEGQPRAGGGVVTREGARMTFRQTFTPIDANHMRTAILRETANGWVPTFPGSDAMVMTRRA